ncbi:MAG: hypothetical protein ACHQNV_00930 [Vicinamibacteria bacterium]
MKSARRSGAVIVIAVLASCSRPEEAALLLTVTPNPIPITVFAPGHGVFIQSAAWQVTVRETAGLGGQLLAIDTTVRDSSTAGPVATVVSQGADITGETGTTRVGAHGALTVSQRWSDGGVFFPTCTTFLFDVHVSFIDDNGNRLEASLGVPQAQRTCS